LSQEIHFLGNRGEMRRFVSQSGARCEIVVREYDLEGIHPKKTIPKDGYNELLLYASEDAKQRLKDMPTRRNGFKPAKCFLVIDNDTTHSYQLTELCLQALLLHTTKGAVYYDFFFFDSNNVNPHSSFK
jgi:hypothetical protein